MKLIDRLLLFICSRVFLLTLGAGLLGALLVVMYVQASFVIGAWPGPVDEVEHAIDSFAGLLVAGGVFFESRAAIRKLVLKHEDIDVHELHFNEVAEHNGIGILITGLALEVATAMLGFPDRLFDSHGIERGVVRFCLLSCAVCVYILFDFVRDFSKGPS